MRILVGDIGGTNTRLAQWDGVLEHIEHFSGAAFPGISGPIGAWLSKTGLRPDAACLAVAGPVIGNRCAATNLPWVVDGRQLEETLGFPCQIVNDFAAAARGTALVGEGDRVQLGGGSALADGVVAVLGAGTGLGEAVLVGDRVVAGEGGHAEFGPSNERETRLAAWLVARFGRASWELVLSGAGLVNLYCFACVERGQSVPEWTLAPEGPARVVAEAPEIVEWFCELYGSEAGNMALRSLPAGGVYLAGGIAPRVLPALQRGGFRARFEAKGKVSPAIRDIPVFAVTHPALGLLGAAASWGKP